jgi:hypothetical protein
MLPDATVDIPTKFDERNPNLSRSTRCGCCSY